MKRLNTFFLATLLLIAAISGCSGPGTQKIGKLSVVCTIFPQYDWARQILGASANSIELSLLMDNRIDLHNYQPSMDDIIRISDCDLFIYVGGNSDKWVGDVLKDATNKDMIVVSLLDVLGGAAKDEELTEGMEDEGGGKGVSNGRGGDDGRRDDSEFDEHVWLSLRNAQAFCSIIAAALSSLDPFNAEAFEHNAAAYIDKLAELDAKFSASLDTVSAKTIVCGDRFPFRYLFDDYSISYFAAFPGCSAETEASFETVFFLAGKMDELALGSIIVTESSDKRIAETIIRESSNSNQRILVLDAMQSVTSSDILGGMTYLSVMEKNLNVLEDALDSASE